MQIVFDIGGTNMRVARVDGDVVLDPARRPTPEEPEAGIAQLIALIDETASGRAVERIAGGIPGVPSEDGAVLCAAHLPQWTGAPLGARLSERFGARVTVRHDADLAGLGEAVYGAGRGARVVAYAGIGTGVGMSRIVGGVIDAGRYPPEAGHQIVQVENSATLEDLVGGRSVSKKFGMHPRDVPRSAYDEMTPVLAAGLYNTILHWTPDVLVLGGSMMNEENGFKLGAVAEALKKLPTFHPALPELKTAQLRDNAGLEGARVLLASS